MNPETKTDPKAEALREHMDYMRKILELQITGKPLQRRLKKKAGPQFEWTDLLPFYYTQPPDFTNFEFRAKPEELNNTVASWELVTERLNTHRDRLIKLTGANQALIRRVTDLEEGASRLDAGVDNIDRTHSRQISNLQVALQDAVKADLDHQGRILKLERTVADMHTAIKNLMHDGSRRSVKDLGDFLSASFNGTDSGGPGCGS